MYLGIEIGGTKLQLGVGPGDGTIVALERAGVDAASGATGIRQQILRLVPELLASADLGRSDIRAVGIGFGGPVDAERGTIVRSHHIAGWHGVPLADWCRRELGWPAAVHNDADTAGLAEACFGAGRGYSPIFYITIGSGIGGGLIIDQRIYRGAGAGAAEIGHMQLPPPGVLLSPELELSDAALPRPIVESICSGWSIGQRMQHVIATSLREHDSRDDPGVWAGVRRDAEQLLALAGGQIDRVTAKVVAQAAESGSELARRHLAATWRVLGWAVAQMITLLCPRRVVIGGGVAQMGEQRLLDPLRREISRYVFPPFASCYEVVPAALGEPVVVHGALRLARDAN
jgi:glucokinase